MAVIDLAKVGVFSRLNRFILDAIEVDDEAIRIIGKQVARPKRGQPATS